MKGGSPLVCLDLMDEKHQAGGKREPSQVSIHLSQGGADPLLRLKLNVQPEIIVSPGMRHNDQVVFRPILGCCTARWPS